MLLKPEEVERVMMKYKGVYLRLFSMLIRKPLRKAYGKETARRALKNAPGIFREMLTQVDDIGADNPMAGNIYMCSWPSGKARKAPSRPKASGP